MKHIALFACAILFAGFSVHAGDTIANPKYTLWASFKPGSSSTLSGDVDVDNTRTHFETTRTLISVAADQVVIESVTKVTTAGHEKAGEPVQQTISATAGQTDIKEAGNREIIAMGKTFKCKVWDATGENPNDATHSGMGDASSGAKAVYFINTDVPGGVVERDGVDQNGKQLNLVLTAMAVK